MSAHTRRKFLGGGRHDGRRGRRADPGAGRAARCRCMAAPAVPPALAALYPQGDWHVDDICGHLPRYAHPDSIHARHVRA